MVVFVADMARMTTADPTSSNSKIDTSITSNTRISYLPQLVILRYYY